jgi:Protein of unknown function (DUF2934)
MTHPFNPLWFSEPSDQAAHRQTAIAEAAYFRAQRRGFAPEHELEDWVAAEREVCGQLATDDSAPPPAPSKSAGM